MTDGQAAIFSDFGDFIRAVADAARAFLEALRRLGQAIADHLAPIVRALLRQWRTTVDLYLVPRQYRISIMRRKVRRAARLGAFRMRQ